MNAVELVLKRQDHWSHLIQGNGTGRQLAGEHRNRNSQQVNCKTRSSVQGREHILSIFGSYKGKLHLVAWVSCLSCSCSFGHSFVWDEKRSLLPSSRAFILFPPPSKAGGLASSFGVYIEHTLV